MNGLVFIFIVNDDRQTLFLGNSSIDSNVFIEYHVYEMNPS